MKKLYVSLISAFLASSCTLFQDGDGQVIYHWERENTGVQKFARDHSECMRQAEDFKLLPDVRTWFFSEEVKMNIRADWHSEKAFGPVMFLTPAPCRSWSTACATILTPARANIACAWKTAATGTVPTTCRA